MIYKKHIAVLLGIIISLSGSVCIGNEILILGNEYKPPKIYLKNGKPKGILVEIMKYIEQETKCSFNIDLFPWNRSYNMAKIGMGGIIGLSMNQERLKIFDYSDIMFYDDMMIVVLKKNEFLFNKLENLKGKRIGARRGSRYGDEFEYGRKNIFKVDEDSNAIQRLKKLLRGRIDAALIGPGKAGVNQIINADDELHEKKEEFVLLPKPFKRDPNYLGFAKSMNMKPFLKEFNRALKKGQEDGIIQDIVKKHLCQ